jgi:glycosyltransferase involved in cell wall biosynthesis
MKIAVYAICKDEEKFVDRFMDSCAGADGVYVLDTGSSDGTVEKLRARGAKVVIKKFNPWRFDAARNAALGLIPHDYSACVVLDLDEVLVAGWREAVEHYTGLGCMRIQANYAWSPTLTYYMDRAHARHDYWWQEAVHESLVPVANKAALAKRPVAAGLLRAVQGDIFVRADDFKVNHFPDGNKSRGQYLKMLETACKENSKNDRNCHYLGREYWYNQRYDAAILELKRHVAMPHAWDAERAASMGYIARCYARLGDLLSAEQWHLRSCAEYPASRENWLDLAQNYLDRTFYAEAYAAASRALRITAREKIYLDRAESWAERPCDIMGTSAWYLGLKKESLEQLKKALSFKPDDARLRENVRLVEELLAKG